MEPVKKSVGSGLVNMVPTARDYWKAVRDLHTDARQISNEVGNECYNKLSEAFHLIGDCLNEKIKFDFTTEEKIKACIFSTRDWLATKTNSRFYVFHALYKWKLEKFHHRAWDASMTADQCEGLLFRLMERVCDESQNIAVTQVFLSIQELESAADSAIRIETRIKDALDKLKKLVDEQVPLVGVAKTQ